MRSLRADNIKLTKDVTQLSEKNEEAQRKVALAEAAESSLRLQLKSADSAARRLKEEVARTKALVAQARATCANDVRRRDRQIDTLKKQLGEAGRARGARANPAITTINVTGDFGAERRPPQQSVDDEYSLRSETNDFLAKLVQDLSQENEAVMGAMRHTMDQLRQMSGWGDDESDDEGAPGDAAAAAAADAKVNEGPATRQPSWQEMASELEPLLDHMKNILTNPSFVPIEEVELREEEINRLKEGWVKMESRWREAVHLIDGWRRSMADGRPVRDEDLQMGLRLSPVRIGNGGRYYRAQDEEIDQEDLEPVAEEEDDQDVMEDVQHSPAPSSGEEEEQPAMTHVSPAHQRNARQEESRRGQLRFADKPDLLGERQQHVDAAQAEEEEPQQSAGQVDGPGSSRSSSPLPERPQLTPLRNLPSAGNRRPNPVSSEKTLKPRGLPAPVTARPSTNYERPRSPSRTSLDEALLSGPAELPEEELDDQDAPPYDEEDDGDDQDELADAPPHKTPRTSMSGLPTARGGEDATTTQQSPLTMQAIAAKLAASEREADAARVRSKLKSFRGAQRPTIARSPVKQPQQPADEGEANDKDVDPVKRDAQQDGAGQAKPEKRKRDRGTTGAKGGSSRRRSTLSPWELDTLISGKAQ